MIEDIFGKVIYVFETNIDGTLTSSQAKHAMMFYGAKPGIGNGRTGNAYAISTRDYDFKQVPVSQLIIYVNEFIYFAKNNKDLIFEINRFEDHREDALKLLFKDAPSNCMMPTGW